MRTEFQLAISRLPDGVFAVALSAIVPTERDAVELRQFMAQALREKSERLANVPGNPIIIPAPYLPPGGKP
jgi:hypothetical protein